MTGRVRPVTLPGARRVIWALTSSHPRRCAYNRPDTFCQGRRSSGAEAGVIDRIRRLIRQRFMRAERVIVVDITSDRLAQFSRRVKFVDVNQLRFQAAEPPLNHDVVCPARLPVHALLDVQIAQKLLVFAACKLYSLIRIKNCWSSEFVHSVADGIQDWLNPQRIGEIPSYDFSAVPVNDGYQIHMAAAQFDIGDINRPHLIWEGNHLVTQ